MNKHDLTNKIKALEGIDQNERAYLINLINTTKKYGLVWEDKPEEVEEQLRHNLPVLHEVTERRILGHELPPETTAQGTQLSLETQTITDPETYPNHILIEGDNLHALTALTFTHEGKIDVIYIDPPYNTGNKDFIYNDKYIDKEDGFRHSKWLSFMHKRLKIASTLLTNNGVITISIGYQEVNNLFLLCEELFPNRQIVCVTVQTSGGKPSGGFNYLQEYVLFITSLDFNPKPFLFSGGVSRSPFEGLTLSTFDKTQRPNQTYPIFIDNQTGNVVGTGKSLARRVKEGLYLNDLKDFEFDYNEAPKGTTALWPITSKGNQCVWRLISTRLMSDWECGYIKVSRNVSSKNPNKFSVQYLPEGVIEKIKTGELPVVGTENGRRTLIFGENKTVGSDIPTIWTEKGFFTTKGSVALKEMLNSSKFSYPKPLDLISEIFRAISNPSSQILDFFAGSGTTLHATMELNKEDGGTRQCIMVTNNENNICEEVTYERNKRVIEGYVTAKGAAVVGLRNNNLRYYKSGFVVREPSIKNKRAVTQLATELLCIKENCYQEQAVGIPHARLFKSKGVNLLVLLDDEVITEAVAWLKNSRENFKVYVFSIGSDPYTEDFHEVRHQVELCALPDAIYKAYQHVLPPQNRVAIPTLDTDDDTLNPTPA